jgi:hypothetical protein
MMFHEQRMMHMPAKALPTSRLNTPGTTTTRETNYMRIKLRCLAATAAAQAPPKQQRNLYCNYAIYKGKAAASFRVRSKMALIRPA